MTHLKEKDYVHVAGHLSVDVPPFKLSEVQANVQVNVLGSSFFIHLYRYMIIELENISARLMLFTQKYDVSSLYDMFFFFIFIYLLPILCCIYLLLKGCSNFVLQSH